MNEIIDAACKGNCVKVELLLDDGTFVNIVDEGGWTPLAWAAFYGRCKVIELLLGRGANIDAASKKMRTPLMAASYMGRYKTVELLLCRGANMEAVDDNGCTALNSTHDSSIISLIQDNIRKSRVGRLTKSAEGRHVLKV